MSRQQPCRKIRKLYIAGTDTEGPSDEKARRPSPLRLVDGKDGGPKPQQIRLLLIEDSPFDADLFREQLETLEAFHFDIRHCENLADSLESLNMSVFDVVVLDLTLPDCNGYNSFKRVHDQANGTPIIILTGLDERSISIRALEDGAANYLIKNKSTAERIAASIMTAIARR